MNFVYAFQSFSLAFQLLAEDDDNDDSPVIYSWISLRGTLLLERTGPVSCPRGKIDGACVSRFYTERLELFFS